MRTLCVAVLVLLAAACAGSGGTRSAGDAVQKRTFATSADKAYEAALAVMEERKLHVTRQDEAARTLTAVAPGSWFGSDTPIDVRVYDSATGRVTVAVEAPSADGPSMTYRPHWATVLLADIEQRLTPSAPPR